jgi:hypothetical protein
MVLVPGILPVRVLDNVVSEKASSVPRGHHRAVDVWFDKEHPVKHFNN